jgi:RimJ/RimL family protein N-acetyltransferase
MLTHKIVTPNLIIRKYNPEGKDVTMLHQAITESIEHLKPFLPWAWSEPQTLEARHELVKKFRRLFDDKEDFIFGIFNHSETELIGSTGLHDRVGPGAREIGYWININQVNNGYATEAVKALVQVGFDIEKLDRIEIRHRPHNLVSAKIPEKLGFTHLPNRQDKVKDHLGNDCDILVWEITKAAYKHSFPQIALSAFDINGNEIVLE